MAKLTPNEMNFIQNLVNNGVSLETALSTLFGNEVSKPTQPKVETPTKVVAKATTSKTTKKVVNNNNTSSTTKSSKKTSEPALAFGKIKVGDFFKVINLTTNKVSFVGYANKIDKKDGIVTTKSGKKYAIENCVAITKATYTKLKNELGESRKSTKGSGKPKATKKRLPLLQYTIAACLKAKSINPKVDCTNHFAEGKEVNDTLCHAILANIKKELPDWKFSIEEASKVIADNSEKFSKAE